jgi:head-tail adaptor
MNLTLFKRNLAKHGKTIKLQNRAIVPPAAGSPDFDESFTDTSSPKALIKTPRGKVLFDGVGTDNPITHEFCILFVSGVTAETWVEFGGRRFDILDVENCGEKDAILKLRARERGTGNASKA